MEAMTTRPADAQAELLSLAVHEFRTPVTVVSGYLRMLRGEQLGSLSERQHKVVEEAERSCARLAALLSEMSELATLDRPDAPPMRDEVALPALLDEIVGAMEEGRDRGVGIVRTGGGEGALSVRADRQRLTAALTALIKAVVREQGEPGRVAVHIAGRHDGGHGMAAVSIGREGRPNPLESGGPDARLNEYPGGLGLALPIARRVIEWAGGRVWSSADGKRVGEVAVLLPLKELKESVS